MNQQLVSFEERDSYIHGALESFRKIWNDPRRNSSGIRSVFRRWRPEEGGDPTLDMRSLIWSVAGIPGGSPYGNNGEPSPQQLRIIDQAAVLVAFHAVAGTQQGGTPFGEALWRAGLSDHRLMRLLTTPPEGRLEALMRAFQRISREGITIRWDRHEVHRLVEFLYGSEAYAQMSINGWASSFFQIRSKNDSKNDGDAGPSKDKDPVRELDQPSTDKE